MSWPDDPNEAEKIIGPIYEDFKAKAEEDPFFQPFADKLWEELENAPPDPIPTPPGGGGDIFTLVGDDETYDGATSVVNGNFPFGTLLTLSGTINPETGILSGYASASNAINVAFANPLASLPCMVISVGPVDPENPTQTLILKYGIVRKDSWNFNTYNETRKTLFVGSNGGVVQSVEKPESGHINIIQPVGSIIESNIMWFYPSCAMFQHFTFKDGDDDEISIQIPYFM